MLLLVLALTSGCVHVGNGEPQAAAGANREPPAVGADFFDTFYLNPDPERVDAAIRWVAESGIAYKPSAGPVLLTEFNCIFARFPAYGAQWRSTVEGLPEPGRAMLAAAFESPPEVLFENTSPSPSRNDMHWGCFFATGDTSHIAAIVDELDHLAAPADLNLFFTTGSAEWSLSSNARQHRLVRDFLEQARLSAEPVRAAQLDRILRVDPGVLWSDLAASLRAHNEANTWGNVE